MRRLILPALFLFAGSACGADFLWVQTVNPPTTTTSTSTTTTTRPTSTSTRPSTSTTTSTTAPKATTTTVPAAATPAAPPVLEAAPPAAPPPPQASPAPLTGLPMDPARAQRPVLVVKVDNAPKARPQVGLNQADVVFEEGVEGGITRFAVLFHSKDSDPVGPVRSARSTDIALVTPLNHPLFAYSGANEVFKEYVARAPVVDVGYDAHPDRYHREAGRPSPNNLFSASKALFDLTPEGSRAPPALFPYRAPGEAAGGAGAKPASGARVWWRGDVRETMAVWEWDGTAQGWRRTQNGEAHTDGAGLQVTPPNVVIQYVTYKDTGFVDSTGSPVPEAEVVGEGEAVILTGGRAVPAHWSKPSASEVTRYVDAGGAEVRLTPGQTWVELVPPGQSEIS
ncbi:MAG TPA: DUF3048 domain-containing protein [Acidimicrobiia bacterium]|jgi:hypothetical protein